MNANSLPEISKLKPWLDEASRRLRLAGIDSATLDAELIASHIIDQPRTFLHAHPDLVLSDPQIDILNKLFIRRLNREPLAYLIGYKDFYSRRFEVTDDTLIPRPESEDLIEVIKAITDAPRQPRIVDIGTGSGCLGITLALEIPGSDITLSDISSAALLVAYKNANGLNANVTTVLSDLLSNIDRSFDIIVANLPYVDISWERSPETNFEPATALFAADGGLALVRKLLEQAPARLSSGGYLVLEADPEQHERITKYAEPYGFKHVRTIGYALLLKSNSDVRTK